MPAMKKEQDGAHPASHYLVVEDPEKPTAWHLRVRGMDGKPDHGLMGAAHAALMSPQGFRGEPYTGPGKEQAIAKLKALYKSEGMDWPEDAAKMADDRQGRLSQAKDEIAGVLNHFLDSVIPGTAEHSVSFAADLSSPTAGYASTPPQDGQEMVTRVGKLFETGDYPDKAFTFDGSDLQRAVATFEPCPVDLEHVPTVLEGKLGSVQRIYAGEDGKSLMGEVHLPRWLDDALGDTPRKVSATWDRATKRLRGLALVRNPRVSDAALMAAFSASDLAAGGNSPRHDDGKYKRVDTPEGQAALKAHHDMTVRAGANCSDVPASMASTHENKALQAIHDIAHEHLAMVPPDRMVGYSTAPIGSPVGQPSTTTPTTHRSLRMNIREWLTGKAKEEGVELSDLEAAFSGTDPEVQKTLDDQKAELAAQKAENERLSAAFASQQAEKRQADAVTFAQSYVTKHRLPPAAVEGVAALALYTSTQDSTVTFAEGQKSGMVLLKEALDALPDYSVFTTEHIKPEAVAALFNQTETEGLDGKKKPRPEVLANARKGARMPEPAANGNGS